MLESLNNNEQDKTRVLEDLIRTWEEFGIKINKEREKGMVKIILGREGIAQVK